MDRLIKNLDRSYCTGLSKNLMLHLTSYLGHKTMSHMGLMDIEGTKGVRNLVGTHVTNVERACPNTWASTSMQFSILMIFLRLSLEGSPM